MLKIKATPVKAKDLKAGDLFSTADQTYWDTLNKFAVGEKVYIRTDAECPSSDRNLTIYKITMETIDDARDK